MINYSERLNKSNVKELSTINFVKTEILENEVIIYINATNSVYNDNLYYRVARIKRNVWEDNTISYDAISYINGTEKEYKNIKSMLNAIIKAYNEMDHSEDILNWSSVKKIEAEKVEEIKEDNNNVEVSEVVATIENKINITNYIVYNKSFDNKQDAINHCLENDFDPELMIECFVDGVKPVDTSNDVYPLEFQTCNIITSDIDSYKSMTLEGLNKELKRFINLYSNLNNEMNFNNKQIEKYKNDDSLKLQILVNDSIEKNTHHENMLITVNTHIDKLRECIVTFKERYNKKFGRKSPFIQCNLSTDMQAVQDELKENDNIVPVDANSNKKVDNINELKLIKYTGNNEYLKLLSHFINNTIIDYDKRLKDHYNIYDNIEALNKKYAGKLDNFYNDYNISNDKFCELFTCYKCIKMLQRIDINNILIAFDTIISKDKLYHKSEYQILNAEELNNIRYYLFNNSYSIEFMCNLEEQNNILKNYPHFDRSIKKIKVIA